MSTTLAPKLATPVVTREPRPFAWLSPARALSATAVRGLDDLRILTEDAAPTLTRALVEFSLHDGQVLDLVSRGRSPSVSVLNRRRRAARLWIIALLEGQCDAATLRQVCVSWLPQLAGTGPDPRTAISAGRRLIEFLRGSVTAILFDSSAPNLVPHARALSALEGVLAVHLRAIEGAAEPAPKS